jgi:outer membrane protein TolC
MINCCVEVVIMCGMVSSEGFVASAAPEAHTTDPPTTSKNARHVRPYWTPLGLIFLIAVSALSISCNTHLVNVRQGSAAHVLQMYRARPLAVANFGRTDVTLHDCKRLALQNSLELQAAAWEEQIKGNEYQSQLVRMFPKMEGRYELTQRDLHAFSRSDVLDREGLFEVVGPGPGSGVTNYSTGRERSSHKWQVELKWSPMDAAIARYLSRVKCNEGTYARYQRVRVAQQLIGTVTGAFYRLLALNEALPKAQALEANRKGVVRDLRELAKDRLVESEAYILSQSRLAEAKALHSRIYTDIGRQRELLAVAMNVCPDASIQVKGRLLPLPHRDLDACKLEAAALVNRPECYQADLTHLNSAEDHKRLFVELFPRFEGFIGYYRDSNKFLLANNWVDGGLRVTWDLMEFASDLLQEKAAKQQVLKTDKERSLISVGVLSQVRLETLKSVAALDEFKKMTELRNQAQEKLRIAQDVEEVKDRGAPQRVMRINRQMALCDLMESEVNRILSVGEVHASFANLRAAVGSNYPVGVAHPPAPQQSYSAPVMTPVTLITRTLGFATNLIPW